MDQWQELRPTGCNVWMIVREMYGSGCVAVHNRSDRAAYFELDFSQSRNVSQLGSNSESLSFATLIAEGKIRVVLVLSPTDDTQPMRLCLNGVVKRPPVPLPQAIGVQTTVTSLHPVDDSQSAVQEWLESRKSKK